jgi:hypothetical protein
VNDDGFAIEPTYRMGFDLEALAYTIDIVSGRPVDRRVKDRLFDPLRMGDARRALSRVTLAG